MSGRLFRNPRQGLGISAAISGVAAHRLDTGSRFYEPIRGPQHEFLEFVSLVSELSPAGIVPFSDPADPVQLIDQHRQPRMMTFAQLYPRAGIRLTQLFQELMDRVDITCFHSEDETAISIGKLKISKFASPNNPLGGEKRASVMAKLAHPAALLDSS